MAKDPAFLFYYQDFLVGTEFMSNEEIGIYIRMLCHLADKGTLAPEHMLSICKGHEFTNSLKSKFETDEKGNFFNPRLKDEILKRRLYAESRRKNASKKPKAYAQHMEDENENENINKEVSKKEEKKERKIKKFIPPTLEEVKAYFEANGYSGESGERAFKHYALGDWKDTSGKPVISWKQKMNTVWFRPENKKPDNRKGGAFKNDQMP